METDFKYGMQNNINNYLNILDRLTEKYVKLSKQVVGKEVDLNHQSNNAIARSIAATELETFRVEAEMSTSEREYSYTDGNKTNDSQIDSQVEKSNESIGSNNSIMDGVSEMEQTQASGIGLLDDTQGNLMDVLVLPDDQDEELERTLSSHHSTLMELFPQMISQMGKDGHRQHSRSVLKKYRKMRQIGSNTEETTNPTPTPIGGRHDLCSPGDEHNLKAAAVRSCVGRFPSPAQRHSTIPRSDGHAEFHSSMQSKESMNQTFTVSKGPRPCSPLSGKPQGQSPAQTLRFNRSNGPYVMESSTVPKSPVWLQRLLKTRGRNHNGCGGSPKAYARHNPASSSIHEQHSRSSRRQLYYHQDSPSPSRSDSPQSFLRTGGLYSPAKLEEAFTHYYHKFICLAKSPLSKCSPCRCSAQGQRLKANIRHSSSSALSALALSPHRSNLRKRVRELDRDMSPSFTRPGECNPSPGSLRHFKARRLHL